MLSSFFSIAVFGVAALLFLAGGLAASWLIRPRNPNDEKLSTYECGEDAVGSAWGQFNPRFYVVGIIFILFDVELLFLFPCAVIYADADLMQATNGLWGWFALAEIALFVVLLGLGLAWAWAKGLLDWVKPHPKVNQYEGKVPAAMYQNFNEKYLQKN